ncbi:nuclear transport factor 2 family protein [Actinoplanes bogorensis]|uniref:Nuclear transport factor 2 family protein n=1 Tax=Paractinoplanes bogorensis TaxID=1610840 RepID=A0ABS5YMN9_9ACTN|nr:nuclear transport factor 2 family protein [Actinoplanes bogorensis]MBU2664721.1 nuclear transport factor 2 family protein [Actinoplanes bogorensis]
MRRIALLGITSLFVLAGCDSPSTATPSATGAASATGTAPSAGNAPSGSEAVAAPAQAYVDAVAARDLGALAEAFAPDAVVIDVTRRIEGRDAIREWADNEVIGGSLRVLSATPMDGGQDLLVHWAPSGSAGWEARYRFTMNGSHITQADLQYA